MFSPRLHVSAVKNLFPKKPLPQKRLRRDNHNFVPAKLKPNSVCYRATGDFTRAVPLREYQTEQLTASAARIHDIGEGHIVGER